MENEPRSITWKSTKIELNRCRTDEGQIDYDRYINSKLSAVEQHTQTPLVVYATDFLNSQKAKASGGQVGIDLTDLQGFDEVTKDLPPGPLDLMIHSPGGLPEAAESIVQVLRNKFTPLRVIVPFVAKSAATMVSLSADEIFMPKSAELGPIDPQFPLADGAGNVMLTPAQAILDQFHQAQVDIQRDQRLALVWSPILQKYGTGILTVAQNAIQLSKKLVYDWLMAYMLKGEKDADAKAKTIVEYLGSHNEFLSHARRVNQESLINKGVRITDIATADSALWQLIESSFYSIQHLFEDTTTFKVFQNSRGQCLMRMVNVTIPIVPQQKN